MLDFLSTIEKQLQEKIGGANVTDYTGYRKDYTGFAHDILGIDILTDEQISILDCAEKDHARIAVPSANGCGKTFIAATLSLAFLYTHYDNTAVITTAPTHRQVKELLWREINNQHRRSNLFGTCLQTQLTLGPKWFGFGFASDKGQSFQGFHAENVLLVVDEANGFNEGLRDALESIVVGNHTCILLIGNPLMPEGWFYDVSQSDSNWDVIQIDAFNHPNVKSGVTKIPGAITREKVAEFAETYGEGNPIYLSRVRGQFPEGDNLSTIIASRQTVRESIGRELPHDKKAQVVNILSVDCARQGQDFTVLLGTRCYRYPKDKIYYHEVIFHERHQKTTVPEIAILIKQATLEEDWNVVIIDEVGAGGGVIDILNLTEKFRTHIEGFNGQKVAERDDVFMNRKAEGYVGCLKKAFSQRRICLDNFKEWEDQLARLHYGYTMQGSGKIKMEDKRYDPTQHRILVSPDDSDALMQAVWAGESPQLMQDYRVTRRKLKFGFVPA